MSQTGWDLDTGSNGSGTKTEFTKFPEGITRIRIVDEAPFQRWTHWQQKHKRSINCPGKGCPICDIRRNEKANKMPPTQAIAKRFAINVINRETNRLEILEQGKTFFEDVRDLMEDLKKEGKKLSDADFKVRRRGTTKDDTSYRVDIDEKYPLSDADLKLLENRVDLQAYFTPHTNEQILRILNGEAWEDVMKREEEVAPSEEAVGTEEEIEIV